MELLVFVGTSKIYCKILRIRLPFDAQKVMPKIGGGLICEDLTFCIKVKSRNEQLFKVSKESRMSLGSIEVE